MTLTPLIQKAINAACMLHDGQKRKGHGTLPYVSHLFSVAWMIAAHTDDGEVIAAGLLHDALEDVRGFSYAQLEADFGGRVAGIVKEVSEEKDPNVAYDKKATWEARKREYIERSARLSDEALLVTAADKTHNLLSTIQNYRMQGEALWGKFNATKEQQVWFNGEMGKLFRARKSPLADEFDKAYKNLRSLIFP